jgi:hypothetical protein
MSRLPFLAMGLLATALLAVMALELDAGAPAEDATGIVPLRHAPLARARAPTEDPVDHTDAWVKRSLARPLFSRDRRPTPVVARAGGGSTIASVPRLSGTLVGPFGRSAIFAGESGGKPVVVAVGGSLGGYTVQAIEPGHVTISGPEGVRQLQPSYDAAARRAVADAAPPAQPPMPLPGQLRQQLLNIRPGNQFPRGLPGAQNERPAQQGDDTQ